MLYTFNIDGEKFDFNCDSVDTRDGFAHIVDLYQNNNDLSNARENYLNRTWECYIYQTAMIEAVKKAISERRDYLKDCYKYDHGISRVSYKIMEDIYNRDQKLITLEKLKDAVKEYRG